MRIGVVGSGIAGLTSARLLTEHGHQVTLFEKRDRIGMDAYAVAISDGGLDRPIDVPARLLNHAQWPNLLALYEQLGVAISPVDPTQSYGDDNGKTYLSIDLASLFRSAAKGVQTQWGRQVVSDAIRLQRLGQRDLRHGIPDSLSLSQYLRDGGYSDEFQFGFLYPVLSTTVCTCSYDAIENYPARLILQILDKLTTVSRGSAGQHLWRSTHGSGDVVARLLAQQTDVRQGTAVEDITCNKNGVVVRSRPIQDRVDGAGRDHEDQREDVVEQFEHVVLATQANQALGLLPASCLREREALHCFEYESVEVIVHTDPRLMPAKRSDWATFNMIRGEGGQRESAMCSIWMNRFDPTLKLKGDVFQTIQPIFLPSEGTIQARHAMQRPVVNQRTFSGWRMLKELHREATRRLWFVGSYASPGIPLLETGVISSQQVAAAIEATEVEGSQPKESLPL